MAGDRPFNVFNVFNVINASFETLKTRAEKQDISLSDYLVVDERLMSPLTV